MLSLAPCACVGACQPPIQQRCMHRMSACCQGFLRMPVPRITVNVKRSGTNRSLHSKIRTIVNTTYIRLQLCSNRPTRLPGRCQSATGTIPHINILLCQQQWRLSHARKTKIFHHWARRLRPWSHSWRKLQILRLCYCIHVQHAFEGEDDKTVGAVTDDGGNEDCRNYNEDEKDVEDGNGPQWHRYWEGGCREKHELLLDTRNIFSIRRKLQTMWKKRDSIFHF